MLHVAERAPPSVHLGRHADHISVVLARITIARARRYVASLPRVMDDANNRRCKVDDDDLRVALGGLPTRRRRVRTHDDLEAVAGGEAEARQVERR